MAVATTSRPSLHFSDGVSWAIQGKGSAGIHLVDSLSKAMRLAPSSKTALKHLIIQEERVSPDKKSSIHPFVSGISSKTKHSIVCKVLPVKNNFELTHQLRRLAFVLCSSAEANGGILIHGALAEKKGQGVILAGPSGVGKSTASKKLPESWHSLSDDCTLIVHKGENRYYAHPWPTWSTFLNGNNGQNWNVQSGVPLKAVFLLS